MVVNEIFYSLQGEGFLAGVAAVFIRLAGCPLRCRWCDTKYAWPQTAARHVTIETAGIVFLPGLACDLMSISPKLSNSTPLQPGLAAAHEKARLNIAALNNLIGNYTHQLKFVVDKPADLSEIQDTIKQLPAVSAKKVMLMPQAVTKEEFLKKAPMVADMCKRSGFAFGQRLQVLLWNNERGT